MRTLSLATCCLLLTCSRGAIAAKQIEHTKDTLQVVKTNVSEKKAVLLDVRDDSEWDRGHIEGAIHIPLDQIKRGLKPDALPKDKVIYTYCEVGMRLLKAGRILSEKGFQVRPLKPGYQDLLKAGFKKAE